MPKTEHHYETLVAWTGARSGPTTSYAAYSREYTVAIDNKVDLTGSADPTFRGDAALHNPEELLVAALSACHLLTYLGECARNGIEVSAYQDRATGTMTYDGTTTFRFTEVMLRPVVTIAPSDKLELAIELHDRAHRLCFIAQSVNFPVRHEATIRVR